MSKNKTPKNPLNDEQKSTLISWAIGIFQSLLTMLTALFSKKQNDKQE